MLLTKNQGLKKYLKVVFGKHTLRTKYCVFFDKKMDMSNRPLSLERA
jgi:hypothetical protein